MSSTKNITQAVAAIALTDVAEKILSLLGLMPAQVYREAISWDTLVLLLGMMVISSVMARAAIFRWISWFALRRAHGPRALLAVLVLVAGVLSALLVNDTVCVSFPRATLQSTS